MRLGELENCEFINVESEFAALSVAIGASAAGARAYTATASQGLLFMAEAVYNAAGLGLPIVMTLGNRAIGAPINIWNDHSDAMALRESGWMQLFAENNQEAVDLHIIAFRLAEELVGADDGLRRRLHPDPCGRARRHSRPGRRSTPILPPYEPDAECSTPPIRSRSAPWSGPTPSPRCAICNITNSSARWTLIEKLRGRVRARLRPRGRRAACEPIDADDADLARRRDGLDQRHDQGRDRRDARRGRRRSASSRSSTFRPFPDRRRCDAALERARDVLVIDKALDAGMGGPLASNVAIALREPAARAEAAFGDRGPRRPAGHARRRCTGCSAQSTIQPWEGPHFLDLNERVVGARNPSPRQGAARRAGGRSHPQAARIGADVEKLAERAS